jgi:hypothetical protein
MNKEKNLEQVIIVLPEVNQRINLIGQAHIKLNNLATKVKQYAKENIYDCHNQIKEAIKLNLPDTFGSMPVNKDEMLKNIIIPDYTLISNLCNDLSNFCNSSDIDIHKFFIVENHNVILNEIAVDNEKKAFSLIAKTPEAVALSKQYFLMLKQINKYDLMAKQLIGNGATLWLKRIDQVFNIDIENNINYKPAFIELEILKNLNNKKS